MSGIESTREIRALEMRLPEQYKRSFIIALTGLAAGSDRDEAFTAGIDAFMVKPVSFKDLEKMLQHVGKGMLASEAESSALEKEKLARNNSIVSLESSRGKHIEIKQQLLASSTDLLVSGEEENKEAG
jgi:CheY-like chemotaxis protein